MGRWLDSDFALLSALVAQFHFGTFLPGLFHTYDVLTFDDTRTQSLALKALHSQQQEKVDMHTKSVTIAELI
jgi:hypothetical protein